MFNNKLKTLAARTLNAMGRLLSNKNIDLNFGGEFADNALLNKVYLSLVGAGDDEKLCFDLIKQYEKNVGAVNEYDLLKWLMVNHPSPHWVNYFLGLYEFKNGIEEVVSLPSNIWMDISSICTVECRFCKYTHEQLPKSVVTLDQIKSIEWFKYIRLLNLTAGTAEALSNPEFIEIFNYIRDTYPHLHITLLTNGRTLDEAVLEVLRNRLDALHVSINASNETDYNRIISNGSWPSLHENLRAMKKIMQDAQRPKITASFVMMKWNLERVVQNLEFAAGFDVDQVLFHHYYPSYVDDIHSGLSSKEGKFDKNESLYFDKERADKQFDIVKKRAAEIGIDIQIPPSFSDSENVRIYYGARSLLSPPDDCIYPWTNMYMLWGFKSKREEITLCCGLASDVGVYFDRDEVASTEGLRATWNSLTMKAYRKTANGTAINPICKLCREIDRFDPNAIYPDQKEFFEFNGLPVPQHFLVNQNGLREKRLFKGKKTINIAVSE